MKTQTLNNEQQIEELLEHARKAEATGDFAAVVESAQKIVDLAQEIQDIGSEAAGYLWWGRALWRLGDLDAAQSQIERSLALAQKAGARQIEADCFRIRGLISWNQGDYVASRAFYERSLRIAREVGDRRGEGWTLNNLGILFSEQGDYARARAYYETALRVFREIDEVRGKVGALSNLGWTFRMLGDYTESKVYTEQALHAAREIGDRDGEARVLSNLGFLALQLGDYQTAWEQNQQGLVIAQEISSRSIEGGALTALGYSLAGLDRTTEAVKALQQALTIRREMGQRNQAMEILAGLANVTMTQGELSQAQVYVDEILEHLEAHTLDGTEEPVRIYLICYQVLRANQDPHAEAVLNMGHRLLQERASNIRNEEMRGIFLENIAAHREVLKIVRGFVEPAVDDESVEAKSDERKTKSQLLDELTEMRRRNSELEMVASELWYIEESIGEREERFRSIAETASDAIVLFDTYETIFFWNQAAQKIFGYQAHEAHGQLLASIVTREFHQTLRQEIEQVIETGTSALLGKAIEVTGIQKDGKEFPLELSVATWKTKDETFFTAIGRDITERKEAENALQNAYSEVEKQVRARTTELQREIAERERLQQEVIEAQQRAIQELSTPIIPIMDVPGTGSIIVMPLIGSIDSLRAKDITRTLLSGIREHRARVVILDITGVAIVDSGVANHLNKTIQAARLKGARTIITGISDAVAETIVDLGIDWSGIETLSDLQTGLIVALNRLGVKLTRQ